MAERVHVQPRPCRYNLAATSHLLGEGGANTNAAVSELKRAPSGGRARPFDPRRVRRDNSGLSLGLAGSARSARQADGIIEHHEERIYLAEHCIATFPSSLDAAAPGGACSRSIAGGTV
jgi:hypothetical protein